MYRGERVKKRGLSMRLGIEKGETPSSYITALRMLLARMFAQHYAGTRLHLPISQLRGTLILELVQQSASDKDPAINSYTKEFGYSENWYFAHSSLLPKSEAICEELRCSDVP